MITTLSKEAHLIKDRLSGGNSHTDSQLDVRDIIMYYRSAMSDVLRLVFYDNMTIGDKSQIPMYIAFYPALELKEDDQDDINYVDLPSAYFHLPHNKGIVHVSPADTPEKEIYRSNNPYVAMNIPEVANFEQNMWYWVEGLKLKFPSYNLDEKMESVNVKLLIPGPDSIGINDPLPIIPNQMTEIRNRVTQYFSDNVIQDVLNDGNKDRGVNINE